MSKRFKAAYIELTNLCNKQCAFCHGTKRPPGFMDFSLFEKLAPEISSVASMAYLHVMGEALMHPEFGKIVECAQKNGLLLALTTNGSLFGSESARYLLHPPFRQLNISLHSGVSVAELNSILDFSESALNSNPILSLNLRLWDVCPENASYLRQLSERFGVELSPGSGFLKIRDRFSVHFADAFEWPDLNLPERGSSGFCWGGIDQFAVLCDGRVTGCCLDAEGDLCFGRYPEKSLNEILSSRPFEQMRNGFHRGEILMPLCRRCSYRERFV